jgi:myo-inositol-1(or 4)-monophosphatase
LPHFCVSIALLDGEEPVHGVIFDPLRNEIFYASRGGGAFLEERRIRTTNRSELTGSIIITGFPPRERGRIDAQLAAVRQLMGEAEDIRRTGSAALDLAYVAAGRLDGFWEMGLSPWDMAAGALLVTEAGGLVADLRGEQSYLESGDICAATPKVLPALLGALRG